MNLNDIAASETAPITIKMMLISYPFLSA
jgi:hypothetical protein